MQYLVDTGVWLRMFDRADAHHGAIIAARDRLKDLRHTLALTHQNVAEFWNVSTRPILARGGYGVSLDSTRRRLAWIERHATVIPEPWGVYQQWKLLVTTYGVSGLAVHDARLVATMMCSGIRHLVSLNAKDFTRYRAITVLTPEQVAFGPKS